MDQYLIPANSKKSMQIFGLFTIPDLIILGIGVTVTFILLLTVKASTLLIAAFEILPATLAVFLIYPIPNYHNVFQLLLNIYNFYTERRRYLWKGWCFRDEQQK